MAPDLAAVEGDDPIPAHDGPGVVVFTAPRCGPCDALAPVVAALAEETAADVAWTVVDISERPDVARAYGVLGAPTVIGFLDGVPVARANGYMDIEALRSRLAACLVVPPKG